MRCEGEYVKCEGEFGGCEGENGEGELGEEWEGDGLLRKQGTEFHVNFEGSKLLRIEGSKSRLDSFVPAITARLSIVIASPLDLGIKNDGDDDGEKGEEMEERGRVLRGTIGGGACRTARFVESNG